jgi:hypothetical protein
MTLVNLLETKKFILGEVIKKVGQPLEDFIIIKKG